jgi:hypothetical protein
MKRTLLLLILAGFSVISYCQERSAFIGLQAGPSIPVGKYHSKELPDGSFTTTGFSTSIEGAWFFLPWLGAGGQAGMSYHPVDVGSLGYEKVMEDPFLDDVYIRSDPYRNYTVYAGLYFDLPLVQRLSFTSKALGGMLFSKTPYQLYKANYYLIGEKWYEVTSAGDYEFSFLAGAGLKYYLKNCIGFTLNSEFTYNQADFDFITSDGSIRTDVRVISYLNVVAGVFIKLQ